MCNAVQWISYVLLKVLRMDRTARIIDDTICYSAITTALWAIVGVLCGNTGFTRHCILGLVLVIVYCLIPKIGRMSLSKRSRTHCMQCGSIALDPKTGDAVDMILACNSMRSGYRESDRIVIGRK